MSINSHITSFNKWLFASFKSSSYDAKVSDNVSEHKLFTGSVGVPVFPPFSGITDRGRPAATLLRWPTAGRLGTLRSQKWKNPSDLPADPEPGLNPRAHRSWRNPDKEHGVAPCSWRLGKRGVRLPGSLSPADPQRGLTFACEDVPLTSKSTSTLDTRLSFPTARRRETV